MGSQLTACPTEDCDGCEWCCSRPLQELPDHFQSMYRDEILNLYLSMKHQCESCGYPLLQNVTLAAFEDFVVANSRIPGDSAFAADVYPVYHEVMGIDNIARIQDSVRASWGVDVPAQEVAQTARSVYSMRGDATFMERVLVQKKDYGGIWDLVGSINRDVANRLGKQNSVYSNLPDYERYARVFLGDEQPDNAVIPHPSYTSYNRSACTDYLDGSNILGEFA
eukprot:jgi/Mesvir1/1918/Mv22948-RA.1